MFRWINQFPKTSLAWLAFIRIGLGLSMISQSLSKLGVNIGGVPGPNWLTNSSPLKGILDNAVKGATIDPFYRGFLEGVVVPNASSFAQLTTIGELLVGISLLLGFLTRLGAWAGIFLNFNYMLMKGLPAAGGYVDRMFLLLELIMAVTAAGYVLGLDGMLRASIPPWLRTLMSPVPNELKARTPDRQRTSQLA